MPDKTKIEWSDATWNPVTGCTEVSPGCKHCYAKTFAERWRGVPGHHFEQGFDLVLRPERLDQPLRWTKPRRIFVNSMSDLFHVGVPDWYIAKVWTVMAATPQHTYQILTKRHGRMRSVLRRLAWRTPTTEERRRGVHGSQAYVQRDEDLNVHLGTPRVLPNVWIGVSAEDQKHADLRIPALLDTPAAVHWISAEPLLGPVHLAPEWLAPPIACARPLIDMDTQDTAAFAQLLRAAARKTAADSRDTAPGFLDWVVTGGESGAGARPMHPEWARDLRDQCTAAGIPFFFKQHGTYTWQLDGSYRAPNLYVNALTGETLPEHKVPETGSWKGVWRVGKAKAGRELDGRTWDEYPAGAP